MIYSDFKGNKLEPHEFDANFRDIIKRLEALEKCDLPQLGIESIVTEGDRLIFKGPGNSILGDVKLPLVMPRFRGAWSNETDYFYQDWVQREGTLYVCHHTHKAQAFDATYWQSLDTSDTSTTKGEV